MRALTLLGMSPPEAEGFLARIDAKIFQKWHPLWDVRVEWVKSLEEGAAADMRQASLTKRNESNAKHRQLNRDIMALSARDYNGRAPLESDWKSWAARRKKVWIREFEARVRAATPAASRGRSGSSGSRNIQQYFTSPPP